MCTHLPPLASDGFSRSAVQSNLDALYIRFVVILVRHVARRCTPPSRGCTLVPYCCGSDIVEIDIHAQIGCIGSFLVNGNFDSPKGHIPRENENLVAPDGAQRSSVRIGGSRGHPANGECAREDRIELEERRDYP